jgi:asparagine synthase (glutamine-hydrolysing)
MQDRLPDEILKFRKVGLSTLGDALQSPAFKDELDSFLKSDLFQIPYFEHINIQNWYVNYSTVTHR